MTPKEELHKHKWKKDGGGKFIYCACGREMDWRDVIAKIDADAKLIAELQGITERQRDKLMAKDELMDEGREIVEAHVIDLWGASRLLSEFELDGKKPFMRTANELAKAAGELNAWLKKVK